MDVISMFLVSPWGDLVKLLLATVIGAGFGHWLTKCSEKSQKKVQKVKALQKEVEDLKEKLSYYENVEQSSTGNYYVIKATGQAICPICWGTNHKAIPVYDNGAGRFICGGCGKVGIFNDQTIRSLDAMQEKENEAIQDFLNYDPRR